MKKTVFFIAIILITLSFRQVYCAELKVNESILPNGLKILTSFDKNSSLASVNIYVRTGSRNEAKNEEGISHFLEHLFFRGTNNSTGSEFKTQLESLGGIANAETSKDYTRYYINVPAENSQKALVMLIDALNNASFNEAEIDQERKVILEEYNLYKDNPSRIFYDRMFEIAFREHPYAKSPIGTPENIKNFKRIDFLNYREKFYSPSNLIFVLTGNFDESLAIRTISKAYSNIKSVATDTVKQEVKLLEKQEKIKISNGHSQILLLGYYGPAITEYDDIYAVDAACFMLGIGDGSKLKSKISDKDKNIFDISINFQTMKDKSLIVIAVACEKKDPDDLINQINDLLIKTSEGDFSEEDLKRAKAMLINSFIFGNETNAGKAESIGYYETIDSYKFALNYPAKIEKVTKQDIQRVVAKMSEGPCCVLSITPDKKLQNDED